MTDFFRIELPYEMAHNRNRLKVPCVIDGPFNRELFEFCCKGHLVSTLNVRDTAVLDNLSGRKIVHAMAEIKAEGQGFSIFALSLSTTRSR